MYIRMYTPVQLQIHYIKIKCIFNLKLSFNIKYYIQIDIDKCNFVFLIWLLFRFSRSLSHKGLRDSAPKRRPNQQN